MGLLVGALRRAYRQADAPVKKMPSQGPFRILISAVLSTRTQDPVTSAASARLLRAAPGHEELSKLRPVQVEKLIYPVGFYRVKARQLCAIGRLLVRCGQGEVPRTMDELLQLPGVGRKVANIVLSRGFGVPAIAVDAHVHRISNRLGLVRTRTPEQTERQLEVVLPRRHWIEWNYLLVALGQTICRPQHPRCSVCPVKRWCCRIGVADDG